MWLGTDDVRRRGVAPKPLTSEQGDDDMWRGTDDVVNQRMTICGSEPMTSEDDMWLETVDVGALQRDVVHSR